MPPDSQYPLCFELKVNVIPLYLLPSVVATLISFCHTVQFLSDSDGFNIDVYCVFSLSTDCFVCPLSSSRISIRAGTQINMTSVHGFITLEYFAIISICKS